MATSRLALYNEALRVLGERKLASLSENREPRRLLDDVWDAGATKYCLEQGQWNFGIRSTALDHDSGVEPSFGFAYAFTKPTDYVRLVGISSSEIFDGDFDDFEDEGGFWLANVTPLYLRYVSTDASYGGDLSLWPETFVRFVAHYMAKEIGPRLTSSASKVEDARKEYEKMKKDARSKDAIGQPTAYPARGNWVRARHGSDSRDRGSRGRLIG